MVCRCRSLSASSRARALAISSEDEIAELEAQLAKLRSKQAAEIEEELPPEFGEKTMEVPEFDELTLSYRKRVAAIQEAPPAEFLSEAWKEQEAGGGGISLPLPAIGAAVALLIFAVPFGNGGESYRDRDKGVETPRRSARAIRTRATRMATTRRRRQMQWTSKNLRLRRGRKALRQREREQSICCTEASRKLADSLYFSADRTSIRSIVTTLRAKIGSLLEMMRGKGWPPGRCRTPV